MTMWCEFWRFAGLIRVFPPVTKPSFGPVVEGSIGLGLEFILEGERGVRGPMEDVFRIFKGGVGFISSFGGAGFAPSRRASKDGTSWACEDTQLFGRVKSSSQCRQRPMIPSGYLLHNLHSLGSVSVVEVSFSTVPGEGEKYFGLLFGSWRVSFGFGALFSLSEGPAQ